MPIEARERRICHIHWVFTGGEDGEDRNNCTHHTRWFQVGGLVLLLDSHVPPP
jgi:hypothetical protein